MCHQIEFDWTSTKIGRKMSGDWLLIKALYTQIALHIRTTTGDGHSCQQHSL